MGYAIGAIDVRGFLRDVQRIAEGRGQVAGWVVEVRKPLILERVK